MEAFRALQAARASRGAAAWWALGDDDTLWMPPQVTAFVTDSAALKRGKQLQAPGLFDKLVPLVTTGSFSNSFYNSGLVAYGNTYDRNAGFLCSRGVEQKGGWCAPWPASPG